MKRLDRLIILKMKELSVGQVKAQKQLRKQLTKINNKKIVKLIFINNKLEK
jgi:hypothetical protein